MGSSEEASLLKGCGRPERHDFGSICQVSTPSVRPPLGNSRPVTAVEATCLRSGNSDSGFDHDHRWYVDILLIGLPCRLDVDLI